GGPLRSCRWRTSAAAAEGAAPDQLRAAGSEGTCQRGPVAAVARPLLFARVSEMEVEQRVRDAGPQLTTAERRVAEVVLARPQLVGFGTVADLAEAASAGAATVVRLAAK